MCERLASHAAVLRLMRQYNFRPKKNFGQNFLTEPKAAEKMAEAAQIGRDDFVIEIGPGLGGLTQILSEKAAAVTAIELDRELTGILKDIFSDNSRVEIIQGDILKSNISALMNERGRRTAKIAANIPYNITTPVILNLLENRSQLSIISLMIQREAAERLTAKPGGREYGVLPLTASYYANVAINATVPRNCFFPRPNVDSVIVTLDLNSVNRAPDSGGILFRCIRAAFGQRRKTLLNCLRAQDWINAGREELIELLKSCGFDENVRGEALSLEDFIRLSQKLGG